MVGLFSLRRVAKSLNGVATESLPGVEHLATLQALALELRGTSFLMGSPGLSADYKSKQIAHVNELNEQTLDLFENIESEPPEGDGMSARERLRSLVEYLNSTIPISQPLEILSKNDWRANRFMSTLVEDRTRNDVSYVEFLVQAHKKIQYKFH